MAKELAQMLAKHEALNLERRKPFPMPFISDYDGGHPFVESYLGELATTPPRLLGDVTRYAGIDKDQDLKAKIAEFHHLYDGVSRDPELIIPGGGSSAFLATFCTWLLMAGHRSVYYLPPLYYKFAYFFQMYGIDARPVARHHAFHPDLALALPSDRTVLILSDPIWYGGTSVPEHVLNVIARWQTRTGSLVFIDGTFQYMRWNGEHAEPSSRLPAEQTLRLISPTKYLSLHGYRSAYLLTPPALHDELDKLHINLHGDVPVSDRAFAHRAVDLMLTTGNSDLIHYIQDKYKRLLNANALTAATHATSGFFLFARTRTPRTRYLAMDQTFFELSDHLDFVRINLLNTTALDLLLDF
ncbi:aminotransferase class I/II-fold pyridoxal phosphate-dependent enzyme [Amycolatopsis sp. NPDC051071]|uniref:aminotransferase class I/II-fold pyridoxal phosphate-dependent enzyme n=1 Tax=Amycolatopsis sp. NPDC051071 TaxID=3154637 RepID=UPI003424AA92